MIPANFWYCAWRVLPERRVLGHQLATLDGIADDDEHFVVLEGLGDVVEGAALHGRDRRFDRRKRRDHQHRKVVIELLQLLEHGQSVHARHHHVHDRRVEGKRPRQIESLFGTRRQPHVISLARQQRVEDLTHDFFIVDDENGTVAAHHE